MNIQYCSDLHLEFSENNQFLKQDPLKISGEVLLLAGDVLPFSLHKKQSAFIDYVADNFEAVYWIPGNHEYYQYDAGSVADPLLEKIRSNVWLVNNEVVRYKEVNFICSTLWSQINVLNAFDIQRSVSDFFAISWKGEKFTTRQFNELHQSGVSFLKKAIIDHNGPNTIVVTHHVPTMKHYPQQYCNSAINEAFAVELFDFIKTCNAAYWIYGHHHCNTPAFKIGNTTMLTNQLGYIRKNEHHSFNPAAIIKV